MDNMLEHPGTELQLLIKEKGLTQKAFSSILGKKVSEVNELLKGKRNITIQRDYLLHQTLGTPIKYWILKQIDYDYSLLDIEETPNNDVILSDSEESTSQQTSHSERSEESIGNNEQNAQDSSSQAPQNDTLSSFGTQGRIQENAEQVDSSTHKGVSEGQIETQTESQEIPIQEPDPKDDEDFKKRAKIFKSF